MGKQLRKLGWCLCPVVEGGQWEKKGPRGGLTLCQQRRGAAGVPETRTWVSGPPPDPQPLAGA